MPTIAELESFKLKTFDPILYKIIAVRVIYDRGIREYYVYDKLIKHLSPIVNSYVNPIILDIVTTGQMEMDIDQYSDRQSALYIQEDEVRYQIRKIVEFYHGADDARFARSLTEGCMRVIESIVNSDQVANAINRAADKALAE